MRALVVLWTVLAVLPAGAGWAQERRDCVLDVVTAPGSESRYVKVGDETRLEARGGVEATCGPSWVRADSATYFEQRGVLHLYGHVEYRDGSRTLVADSATYYRSQAWVRAVGDVVLTDSENGSTLEGPILHYYPVTAARSVERIFAPERPHLTVYPDTTGTGLPYDVDADRIHLYGDSMVAGAGEVVSVRGDLRAFGDSLHLDLAGDLLLLLGEPRITTENVTLVGDTILGILEDRELREIEAWPNASARGRELSVAAPALRLFVTGGEIERLVAWRGPRPSEEADSLPPDYWVRGETADYVVFGDSMEVLRPGGVLSQVTTVGRARAEAVEPAVPGDPLTGTDWLVGDTIFGFFEADSSVADTAAAASESDTLAAPTRPPVAETSGPEARLRRMVASANARALYHVREEEEAGGGRIAVNYVIGKQVILWFHADEVERVNVVGPSTGVYLEPIPPATNGQSDSLETPPDTSVQPPDGPRERGGGHTP